MAAKKIGTKKGMYNVGFARSVGGDSDTRQKERPRADSKHDYQDGNDADEEEERI